MIRKLALVLLTALPLLPGCAGPAKLAQRSEGKLAGGNPTRAWALAIRALDKEPGNPRARAAAAAAAGAIADDWRRRIRALADADSIQAAEQVLEFASFRAGAARYATVPVDSAWMRDERLLCRAAAGIHYRQGAAALEAGRPKQAYFRLSQTERFVPGYRDAARLAARAYENALTRVAIVPFGTSSGHGSLGREVAGIWRDELAQSLAPPATRFTRVLQGEDVNRTMTVAELDRLSREDAVRIGRRAGADRVVWGSIGGVDSDTRTETFRDAIAHRVSRKDADGREIVEWVEVPIVVVARVRTVTVHFGYELIATQSGATLAHRDDRPSITARALWTAYLPEGDLDDYALVSGSARKVDPKQAQQIEKRWHAVAGEGTTLRQVFEARRSARESARYRRESLPLFYPGARPFVFLEELPPTEDLAFAALVHGWEPLQGDLLRLDTMDDADLGLMEDGSDAR